MRITTAVSGNSALSERGQTVIPKEVRQALGLKAGANLTWTVIDGVATVRPLPEDPVEASIGALKHLKVSTADLLADRRADLEKEDAETAEQVRRWRSTS